ncbi:ATP-binding protein [Myxococcus sp. CA018]|uniref:ATP-binding protein n=1 Tax=Myxococcus sp. CA018 TaxID=2651864 RepID=UPI0013DB31FC|nr:ATP-binding protein [Myxococcus sp. CA018]NOK06352.1 ATP-binding protein [Myxococcus xanthus]
MTSYTASGARRTGDEYQDLQSAEVLVQWLEQPDIYRWVRLETMDGSLDDIQAEHSDGTRRLLQVKFGTDATVEWDWDELTKQDPGKRGQLKPSLLQKWKTSLDDIRAKGVTVSEAALLTNRAASASIRAHLSDAGIVNFGGLSAQLQANISAQLGGPADASSFFASFHFFFKQRSFEVLEDALQQRFRRLGGTPEGWSILMRKIRRWINHKDEPSTGGTITLGDLRAAALWQLPPQIPQGFLVPEDYVAPKVWSEGVVEPQLFAGGERLVIVTGSPGAGKSTYLSWLVERLDAADVPVVRHHYFLSTIDTTLYRTEWETVASDIIGQLRLTYGELVRAADGRNPLPETLPEFLSAAGRHRAGMNPLVVIVDGLDHVWRDTGSEDGLRRLFDLLLPVPDGIVVVVGTQDIDITRIPRKLRDLCPRDRWLEIPTLDGEGVHEWLEHHKNELGLPEDKVHANGVLNELADAFRDVSGGHPLLLHYTLGVARQGRTSVHPGHVRALPRFDPGSSVATYYRALWEDVSPEGHHLLHLLAGFHWAWPRDGLVQCLAPQTDPVRLESAERAIRHLLGASRAGVTAFHESLLAFVRTLPDHQDSIKSLRPQVLDWLTNRAPEYWRWRHEWEERAKNGDTSPLISSATLEWCVTSLVAGRSRTEVAEVVSASGWAALEVARLGVATERHYIDAYLEQAGQTQGVLSKLLWLALHGRDPRSRELELNLFLSRKSQATDEEIEAVAEVAFSIGQLDVCLELFDECADRWIADSRRSDRIDNTLSALEQIMPSLIAASLTTSADGPYRSHVSEYGDDPRWCLSGRYSKALARHCVIGDATQAIRAELRFLANRAGKVLFEAVDEIVRLACQDGFDPERWIENEEARRSGLFRCFRLWVRHVAEVPADSPREVSFQSLPRVLFSWDESAFVELARSYFFSCVASAAEGRDPAAAAGLDARASEVVKFLRTLRDLAAELAASKRTGHATGGAWFVARIATIDPPNVHLGDLDNQPVRPELLAQVVVAITQDLEALYYAETGGTSLSCDAIKVAIEGAWTWPQVWIEDRVERRLPMGDSQAARFLIDSERTRLEESRDYLHTRATAYASLAQFCQIHQVKKDEVIELARLAARNLLGHGQHKDMVLFDVLGGLQAAPGVSTSVALARLRALFPVIQVVDEITDRDETRYLKREFAEVIAKTAPEMLPSYMRSLQRNHHHWDVEAYFTDHAKSASLGAVYEKALASTLVHEDALTAFQERADRGDSEAGVVLANILTYCGRQSADSEQSSTASSDPTGSVDKSPPSIEEYPPSRLTDFVRAVRDAHIFGDTHLAAWTTYWRSKDPDGLLAALAAYMAANGHPHERHTGKMVVDLAIERLGRGAAWDWLISYHKAMYGWGLYTYRLADVEWIWAVIQSRFRVRWLDFVTATSRPQWGSAGVAPSWSTERMVRFLRTIGEPELAGEVIDTAIRWGVGLAANMRLPDSSLVTEEPSLPVALRLLVDRLDCPSRMVQERAAWSLAGLLAGNDTRDATMRALLDWHAEESLELRSCFLLVILHLARAAHGLSARACVNVAGQASLVPSIGVDLLLREFGDEGLELAASLSFRTRHSGTPDLGFSRVDKFGLVVGAHLAPIFRRWVNDLDKSGIAFSRQWEWEATQLAKQNGLSLRLNAHFEHHYRGGIDDPALAINDRLSMVLRSAYLRALHRFIDEEIIDVERAKIHTRRVAVMADPALWAVSPSQCPDWWPVDQSDESGLDTLSEAVGLAVRTRLEQRNPNEAEILLFAAGPCGNRPNFRAEVEIRAFLQSANGPMKPLESELAKLPMINCLAVPPRLSLPGSYMAFAVYAGYARDWMMAPLAWWLHSDTHEWLLPERAIRGIHVPATWLLPGTPNVETKPEQVCVTLGDQLVARYRYWHDELRERRYQDAGSRAGAELVIRREWLEPQLAAGATLCWMVTLSVAQREKYEGQFGKLQVVGTWFVGGSHMVWPEPWQPPLPGE